MIVRCIRECWDSSIPRHYVPGDQDDIDPMNPIAKYFEGWPPGTKVYFKEPANKKKKKKIKDGLREVPKPAPDGQKAVTLEDIALSDMTLKQLKEYAKKYCSEIKGIANMGKEDLYKAIKKSQAPPGEGEAEGA